MGKSKIIVVGIGPGSPEDMTPAVLESIKESDVIVGYKYYFQFIKSYLNPETVCIDTGMKKRERPCPTSFRISRGRENGHRDQFGRRRNLWDDSSCL